MIALNRYKTLADVATLAVRNIVEDKVVEVQPNDEVAQSTLAMTTLCIDTWGEEFQRRGDSLVEKIKVLKGAADYKELLGKFPNAMDSAVLLTILLVNAKTVDKAHLVMMLAIYLTSLFKDSGLSRQDFHDMTGVRLPPDVMEAL